MHKIDIKIDRVRESSHKYHGTELQLLFAGTSIDYTIINTLRQLVYSEIPIYAVSAPTVKITSNNSVYDDMELRRRFSLISLKKVQNNINYLDPKYYPYVMGISGTLHPDKEYPKDPKDKKSIEMYLNITNNLSSGEILRVTTNDLKITIDGEKSKPDDVYDAKLPDLLVKLKKGQNINCVMMATLGIADVHECWAAISQCYYTPIKSNTYLFIIRSLGQRTEWNCLLTACFILITKITRIKKYINDNKDKFKMDEKYLIISIENESDMIGNLIQTVLLRHPKIEFAGYIVDHPSVKEVKLQIKTKNNINPFIVLNECNDYIIELFKTIQDNLISAQKIKFVINKSRYTIKENSINIKSDSDSDSE